MLLEAGYIYNPRCRYGLSTSHATGAWLSGCLPAGACSEWGSRGSVLDLQAAHLLLDPVVAFWWHYLVGSGYLTCAEALSLYVGLVFLMLLYAVLMELRNIADLLRWTF